MGYTTFSDTPICGKFDFLQADTRNDSPTRAMKHTLLGLWISMFWFLTPSEMLFWWVCLSWVFLDLFCLRTVQLPISPGYSLPPQPALQGLNTSQSFGTEGVFVILHKSIHPEFHPQFIVRQCVQQFRGIPQASSTTGITRTEQAHLSQFGDPVIWIYIYIFL